MAASPLAFWWLDPSTVYALGLALIAAVYIGFAVADGRPKVIVAESIVASIAIAINTALVVDEVDAGAQRRGHRGVTSRRENGGLQLAVMIWLCVFPTLTALNLTLADWLASMSSVVRTFVLVTIAVPIVIYGLMPHLHRARARLLSAAREI